MGRAVPDRCHRHLVCAPAVLGLLAVDLLRPGPALGSAEDQHRPHRARHHVLLARRTLDLADLVQCLVEGGGEALVNERRVLAVEATGHEDRPPAIALEQRGELSLGDAGEHGRVGDLVAVQVQDRQDSAVGLRVQELVRVPARRERACLGFAVAHDAGNQEIRVVEGGTEGVHERVAELTAFVDRPGYLRSHVAGNPARERELPKEPLEPGLVTADARIELAVGPFEVGVGDEGRPAVAGAGDVDRISGRGRGSAGSGGRRAG